MAIFNSYVSLPEGTTEALKILHHRRPIRTVHVHVGDPDRGGFHGSTPQIIQVIKAFWYENPRFFWILHFKKPHIYVYIYV